MSKTLKRSVTPFLCLCADLYVCSCRFCRRLHTQQLHYRNNSKCEGPDVAMGGNPKEYVNIAVSCPNNGAVADLSL